MRPHHHLNQKSIASQASLIHSWPVKVFISWSGEQSKHIALTLREWLPRIIQAIEPYMSDVDNEAGDLWNEVITSELESTNFGILCLTPTNLKSEWVHFEAGAISKAVTDKARVIPLRYNLRTTDVAQPLGRFHSKPLDREGILDTLKTMNNALPPGPGRPEDADLIELFDIVWPKLEAKLQMVPSSDETYHRDQRELIEEILGLVRGMTWDDSDSNLFNATMSASGPGYITVSERDTPPSKRMMDRLVKIAGPEGAVTVTGTVPNKVITLQSPNLRPKDPWKFKFDDLRFLDQTGRFLKDYGIKLVLVGDPYVAVTPEEASDENDGGLFDEYQME
jgi:TIR domain